MRKNKPGEFFRNFLESSTHHMMNAAVVLVLLLMMAIVIHSVSRYLFAKSLLWIMEACAFAFMAIVFLALGSTQRLDRHIKVDVLDSVLPKQVHYHLKGLIAPGIALVYVLFFMWGAGLMAWRFYKKDAVGFELDFMPLVIPAGIIPISLLVLVFVLIAIIIRYFGHVRASERRVPPDEEMKSKTSL